MAHRHSRLAEDVQLLRLGKKAAKALGCGYRIHGIGPGVSFVSDDYPAWYLNLPGPVVKRLATYVKKDPTRRDCQG